jgi:hypothetical protein
MKPWIYLSATFVLIVILGATISHVRKTQARRQREFEYQSVLRSYRAALTLGTVRGEVEKYLQSKGVRYQEFCCDPRYSDSEIVKIGEAPAPWYCSRNIVYIQFQFTTGSLKDVSLYEKLEDCL